MQSQQPAIVTFICLLTAVGLLGYMLIQFIRGKHDLLSYRNLFLLGFVHFQALSGFLSGVTGEPWRGQPFRQSTYYYFGAGVVVFTLTFLWAYNRNKIPTIIGKALPSASPRPESSWVIAGIVLGVLVGIASIGVVRIGSAFLSAFAAQMVFGGFIFSVTLATYLWVKSPANPLFLILMILLPPFVLILSTIGSHGRREMVSVILGIIWAMYLLKWRYESKGRTLFRFAVIATLGFIVLVGYTSVRGSQKGVFGLDQNNAAAVAKMRLQNLAHADLKTQGLIPVLFTDTANCSMLTIDRWGHDADKPHQPFFSIYYFLVNPIPRQWWPDKPIGFGKTLPLSLHKREFNEITFGPGVIGHGWQELGFLGIPFYGLLFGFLCKAVDKKLMAQIRNPFFVAATGSLLGHAVGMPRGDIGAFMVNAVGGLIAPFGIMLVLALISGGGGTAAAEFELAEMHGELPHPDDDWEYDDYPDYDDDDQQEIIEAA